MDDLVSVIVPTFNRAYCVGRAIDSVCAQTHAHWELLLVDDGSTDNTAELIAARYSHDPRIRYIYQQNAGVSAARNAGIRASQGEYVAFLDSDDVWRPWKLAVQLACFRRFPEAGMVWTDFEAVDASGNVVATRYLRKMYAAYRFFPSPDDLFPASCALSDLTGLGGVLDPGARAFAGDIYTAMLRGNLVHTSTVMLSRDRIAKVKGFDETLSVSGEDYDFHFRTCKWGSVCFIDVASTVYQLELEDRLTRYKKQLALNFLRTVDAAIARERGTGQFSVAMQREVLTEAHGWLAEELFKHQDRRGARTHALQSLRYRIRQPRLLVLLAAATVPKTITAMLLHTYRTLKARLTHQHPPEH